MIDPHPTLPPSDLVKLVLGILEHEGPGIRALTDHYAGAASLHLSLGVDFEFTSSSATTVVASALGAATHYGIRDDAQMLAQALWETDGPAHLTVTDHVALPEPQLRLTRTTSLTAPRLRERLEQAGFPEIPRRAIDRIRRKLLHERIARLGIDLSRPTGEARVIAEVDDILSPEQSRKWAAQFTLVSTLFGCSERQQRWLRTSTPALIQRPANLVTTRFLLSPRGMVPRLTAIFHNVPIKPVLILARQFSLLEGEASSKIGALSAALGQEEERVDRLEVTISDMEPPSFAIAFHRSLA